MKKNRIGFWSAALAAVFSIFYSVMQILTAAHILAGDLSWILIFAPSIALAPCFVAMMACLYEAAPQDRKAWGHIGVLFSVLYAAFVMIVYVTQLFVVIPLGMHGRGDEVKLLAFAPQSILYVMDGLGYTMMCLSTLFVSRTILGGGLARWLRSLCILNGILALPIFVVYIYYSPVLLVFGALWMVTVPGICILAACHFSRRKQ